MKKLVLQRWFIFSVLALVGLGLLGFSDEKPTWGDETNGFTLQYQLAAGQKLYYESSTKGSQQVDMQGKVQATNQDNFIAYTLVGNKTDDPEKLTGQITIDDMRMVTSQKTGDETAELDRDLSDVIGKSFTFTFSPKGKELDLAGIENITIDMGPMEGGKRDIRQNFISMLPDFPDTPVKIGEAWTTKEETTLPMGSYSVKSLTDTISKIEGYEKVDGQECLRIHSETSGTLEGSGTMMNMAFTLKGNITADGTWFFAYKKGLLIKASANEGSKLGIKVGGEQGMTIPISSKGVTETILTEPPAAE